MRLRGRDPFSALKIFNCLPKEEDPRVEGPMEWTDTLATEHGQDLVSAITACTELIQAAF